ncbi:hypothetical protein JAAARDRAFT_203290, partial [Jaapia argillacea MUCL 33604]
MSMVEFKGQEKPCPSANVIIFGESGVGKSSIVNMVAGEEVAKTSGDLLGCTSESNHYAVKLSDRTINLFDTAGLNEGSEGTVPSVDAIKNLYKLVRNMDDGVHLLVYVISGSRIRQSTLNNYRMFYTALCQERVPIVLIITGLEQEESRSAWWNRNVGVFDRRGMHFNGHACIVGTRGRWLGGRYMFQEDYEESQKEVVDVITQSCLTRPWKMKRTPWFTVILKTIYNSVVLPFP